MRTAVRQARLPVLALIAIILGFSGHTLAEDVLTTTNQTKLSGTLLETAIILELGTGGVSQFPLPLVTSLTSSTGRSVLKLGNGDQVSGQLRDVVYRFRTSSSDMVIPVEKIASVSIGWRGALPEAGEAQLLTLRGGDTYGWLLDADDKSTIMLETGFSDPLRLMLSQIADLSVKEDGAATAIMRNGDVLNGKIAAAVFKVRTLFGVLGVKSSDIQSLHFLTKKENDARRIAKPPAPPTPPAPASGAQAGKPAQPAAGSNNIQLTQPGLAIRGKVSEESRAFLTYNWSRAGKLAVAVGQAADGGRVRYDIFIYDGKTKQYAAATSEGNNTHPVWSPDGKLLAWDYRPVGSKTSEIWVMDADGKAKRALTKRNAGTFADLAWSPDGGRLAFVYSDNLTGVEGLCTINADGSGFETHATSAAESFYNLRWSPDGKKILYTLGMLGTKPYSAVQVIDLSSKASRVLVSSDKKWLNDNGEWSPDGSRVVFVSNRGGTRTLWRADADGANLVQLSNSEYDDAPAWLPGGEGILYLTSKAGGLRQVVALIPSAARTVPLTMFGRLVGGPKVSPDGRYLAFVRVDRVPELWVGNLTD